MAAFQSAGFEFPKKKVIINLSPSHIRKWGTGHDLPIAIRILEACLDPRPKLKILACGELGLDADIRPCGGIAGLTDLIFNLTPDDPKPDLLLLSPPDCEHLQSLLAWRKAQGLSYQLPCRTLAIRNLSELPSLLKSSEDIGIPAKILQTPTPNPERLLPLTPAQARTLKLAAIGKHHALILGPKGVGKSESLHWFRYLAHGQKPSQAWSRILYQESRSESHLFEIPFRQVHAQVRPAHLLGSFHSKGFQAGELSLAHGGILFADEFVEWPRDSKECLREPLQNRKLHLTRSRGKIEVECDLQLVATGNLCPCGGFPATFRQLGFESKVPCKCRSSNVEDYLKRLSGPILDRIDIVTIFTEKTLSGPTLDETPEQMRNQVIQAQAFAHRHFGALPIELSPRWLDENLPAEERFQIHLKDILSLRARHKILRLSRSIQALEQSMILKPEYLLEAKASRFMDQFWIRNH
jgi:magnesium chelatase family protein